MADKYGNSKMSKKSSKKGMSYSKGSKDKASKGSSYKGHNISGKFGDMSHYDK